MHPYGENISNDYGTSTTVIFYYLYGWNELISYLMTEHFLMQVCI